MPRQKHSIRHLFGRGVVAIGGSTAMISGLYAIVPELMRSKHQGDRRALKIVASEWAMAAAISLSRPVGHLGLPVGMRRPDGRPVIMIHGYGMSRANFLLLARRLHCEGLGPFFGFEYWTLAPLEKSAARLYTYVNRVKEVTGHQQVDLIGHSLGGLVARYYVSLLRGSGSVGNLITIGTPHAGTHTSRFGVGPVTRQLRPGSSTLTRLAAVPPPACRCLTIWSQRDAMVVPPSSASLDWADTACFDDLGHLGMLASRRVARRVGEQLKSS